MLIAMSRDAFAVWGRPPGGFPVCAVDNILTDFGAGSGQSRRAPSPADGLAPFCRELRKAWRISLWIRSSPVSIEVARRSRQESDASQ